MYDLSGLGFLVTGGAGFIGSNLVETLLARGARTVRVLDDFSTGRRSNIEPFMPTIDLIEGSLCDSGIVSEVIQGMDYVLHQGAIPSVPRSIEEPALTTSVNVDGTVNILAASARAGVRRVVFASSSSVYGDSPQLPKHEDMPLNTLSPYAASKAACEFFCRSFYEVFELETVCLRYFNIFGPRQDPDSQYAAVIPKFIKALRHDQPVPVFGDGLQTRDFTFVGNVVEANLQACFQSGAAGECFNIGCGQQTSILGLAQTMAEVMGKPLSFEHSSSRVGDVRHSLADISKARSVLAYEPRVGLREGLSSTISYFWELTD